MKKQTFYYKHKGARFEYREEPEGLSANLHSNKKLLVARKNCDWNKAVNIFND